MLGATSGRVTSRAASSACCCIVLLTLIGAAPAAAAPSPDPAPDPAPAGASPPAPPAPSPPPSAPAPLAGATTSGAARGATAGVATAEPPVAASIVDAVPVSSRTSDRIAGGSGATTAQNLGLLLSLVLLGIAFLPGSMLLRAGTAGTVIATRRPLIAIVGLAIAVGALVNVLLGSTS